MQEKREQLFERVIRTANTNFAEKTQLAKRNGNSFERKKYYLILFID